MRITIAIDFDGVIHLRPRTEYGAVMVTGEPVPGAFNFLHHLTTAADVVIFSARFNGYDGIEAIKSVRNWMLEQFHLDSAAGVKRGKQPYSGTEVVDKLKFTAVKPIARVILDDRAVTFNGIFPKIPDLLSFRTWTGQ